MKLTELINLKIESSDSYFVSWLCVRNGKAYFWKNRAWRELKVLHDAEPYIAEHLYDRGVFAYDGVPAGDGQDPNQTILEQMVHRPGIHDRYSNMW